MFNNVRLALKLGFYGGIIALFISVIGMVETFDQRNIINGVVSIGLGVLLINVLVIGYQTAARIGKGLVQPGENGKQTARARAIVIGNGSLAGAVVSSWLALLVLVESQINLRSVLINVSPELISLLTFGLETGAGALLLLFLGTLFGGLGAFTFSLPSRVRRPLVAGLMWLAFWGLLSGVIRTTLSEIGIPSVVAKLFVKIEGLTPLGAVIIFLLAIAINLGNQRWREPLIERITLLPPTRQRYFRFGTWALGIILLLALPWIVGRVTSDTLVLVGIYILMGFGLNIVVGKAGLLDLGYVAFFAVGAYSTAILTSADEISAIQISFWAALPIIVIITGIAGLLVGAPVLRMRGDYLAIVTLGFGEIARFIALSDWFKPWLGGAQGVINIPSVALGNFLIVGPQKLYYLILAFALFALFISRRLDKSRVGRAWEAMREDEDVAETMGVNTIYYKLLAFAMGAMIASLGGAVFAVKLSAIFPHSFNVEVSITALSLLIIGGIGSLPGVVVGAFALVGIPELLREFSEYRLLLYGAVLIIMMIVRPEGLVPSTRRARELHEDEAAQDDWLKSETERNIITPAEL
ncbi:MAG: branched-chain amino acid ABC transporter permease [Chloroflexi bacterium]|nr:branched-chain amino acid ABC transporter permease [Chloroflexota bacterium]